jgi:hypothetical protein
MVKQPSWPVVMMTTLRLSVERRGQRIRRRGLIGISAALIAGLAVALAVVLIVRPGPTSASVRSASASAQQRAQAARAQQHAVALQAAQRAALQAQAVLRGQAAAWVTQQVSPAAVVSCDPAMCSALQAAGLPGSQLLVLALADADPLGSDVVVATSAVRSQFGARLISVYAPEVIASFGSGALRIDIRAIAPDGAAAFESALAAESAARITAGKQLLRNKAIHASKAATAALDRGDVDPRLLVTLAGLAAQQRVSIVAFGDPSPGAPDVPLRSAEISAASRAKLRAMLSFLRAQRAPYLAAHINSKHFTIDIGYEAPGPLGMGGE